MSGLALAVTGCSGRGKTGNVVYNSSAGYSVPFGYDCMGYEIIRDAGNFDYSLKNTSTGETYPLARSPMFGVFSDEEDCQCSGRDETAYLEDVRMLWRAACRR